jgi:hypothetical protein
MLHRNYHGFEDVHIPAIRDAQSNHVVRFRHQSAAQRNPQIARHHSKNHWLPHPDRVSAFHAVPPELEVNCSNTSIVPGAAGAIYGTGG